jgi:hypothetical protein
MAKADYSGRTEQRKAALRRLADAKCLVNEGTPHRRGGLYLAGYAIECKLKAIAMEVFGCWSLADLALKWDVDERDVYSHGLEPLAARLPLYGSLQRSPVWRDFATYVNRWNPSWRYNPREPDESYAISFTNAVERVFKWLESNRC